MMRIVEQSSNHLRLSNADAFWIKRGFLAIIVAVLLSGILLPPRVRPRAGRGLLPAASCFSC